MAGLGVQTTIIPADFTCRSRALSRVYLMAVDWHRGAKVQSVCSQWVQRRVVSWVWGGVGLGRMPTAFVPNGGLRMPFTFPLLKFSNARSIHGKEIADGTLLIGSQRGLLQPSVSIIRSEGNKRRRPQRNASADRAAKGVDRLKDSSTTSDETSKSSSQEKIIALFKRIQTSISKGGSARSKRRSPSSPKEKKIDESVLGSRRKYVKQKQARDKVQSTDDILSSGDETTDDAVTSAKFKMSRPVTSFVKRSPIPQPSLTLESVQKVSEEHLPVVAAGEKSELQKLDNMKLPELKELARKRGVKGYSKLKKGDLLELLKGLSQSS